MAVYTNDLRLKEIATGDESGTWGTSTNTNLSLIADAFSFGTEAITTNADTHTTTIADGAADPGRSIFLKYTGTLDSACTITIGPNTVSKLWLIENATSGSQNIIIKQGSGATITIANGQTKAIYSDGAGSGGAMVDAFQDLSIPDLFIDDDLTFTSDSAVITFGADGDTTLTHTDGSGLTLNSTNKLMFNDASQFIQGSSATVLSLGATDEIDLTATAIDVNGTMDVSGAITSSAGATITVTDNSDVLTLVSTDGDNDTGPVFVLKRNSASPADNDFLGRQQFVGKNDAGEEFVATDILTRIIDASDGTEDARLDINTMVAGTSRNRITVTESEAIINEGSIDVDFRVESNGQANMLFVDGADDAVVIGNNASRKTLFNTTATAAFQIEGTSGNTAAMSIVRNSNDDNGPQFVLGKTNGVAAGAVTVVTDDALLGRISFQGADGTQTVEGARVEAFVDSTPGADDMPGRLVFSTTADGASTVTERMRIDSAGEVKMTRADNGVNLTLECTDTDANAGPNLKLERNATGASDDEIGNVIFHGRDNAGVGEDYGLIAGFISDATHSSVDGRLNFKVQMNGTSRDYLILNGGGSIVLNQDAQDVDTRIESDGNANMLFVDAANDRVGIGSDTSAASTSSYTLSVKGSIPFVACSDSTASSQTYGGVGIYRTKGSNSEGTGISLQLNDDAGNVTEYSYIGTVIKDAANGSEDGEFIIMNTVANSSRQETARFGRDEIVLNDVSRDLDFRVESDANAFTIFMEASSGIVNFGRGSSTLGTDGLYVLKGEVIGSIPATANTFLVRNTTSNAYSFYVSGAGQIHAVQTSISSLSDERLKENIVDIDTGLAEVMALQPRKFDWKEGEGSNEKNVSGFVAQEVETVLPNLVADYKHDHLDDAKSLKMGDMIPILVKAIQEQQEQIEELKAEVAKLKGE